MEMSVIVFDSGLSVPGDAGPWITPGNSLACSPYAEDQPVYELFDHILGDKVCGAFQCYQGPHNPKLPLRLFTLAGQYPASAAEEDLLGSDGLFPWPLPGHSCTSPQDYIQAGKRPYRMKGLPCREGQAIAIPQLKTPLPGTKACLIFVQRPQKNLELLELNRAILTTILHGNQRVKGAISRCAASEEVNPMLLPIDLTTLAACFASILPAHGLAIAPSTALDPENPVSIFHRAELGIATPTGNVILEHFEIYVSHPNALSVKKIGFWVIAMPSWLPPGKSSLASAPGESSEANAPI